MRVEVQRLVGRVPGRAVEIEDHLGGLERSIFLKLGRQREKQLRHLDRLLGSIDHRGRVGKGVLVHQQRYTVAVAEIADLACAEGDQQACRVDLTNHKVLGALPDFGVDILQQLAPRLAGKAQHAADAVLDNQLQLPMERRRCRVTAISELEASILAGLVTIWPISVPS